MPAPVALAARARRTLARHPSWYWFAVVCSATMFAWATGAALAGPARAREAWGHTRAVWIADRDIAAGTAIVAHQADIPAAMIPERALTAFDTGVASAPIGAGEILVDLDLAGSAGGPWALVPPGWRAIATPRVESSLDAQPTDHVDVYWSGGRLATDAIVVATSDATITIAVLPDDAGAVAMAATDSSLVLVLATPRSS